MMEARSETADGPKKKKMKAFSMHKILFGFLKNRLNQNKLVKLRRCVKMGTLKTRPPNFLTQNIARTVKAGPVS